MASPLLWQFPENPFDYQALVSQPQGIGNIPTAKLGTKIGIIGAGCSGLCAAYELMKIGLHPVVYEAELNPDGAPRIGGRAYTYFFPEDPRAYAELGAMRFATTQLTLIHYLDRFGLDYRQPFPDPLVVPTTLYFNGEKYYIPLGGALPPVFQKITTSWQSFISPLVDRMVQCGTNPGLRRRQWEKYVELYAHKSFYEVLQDQGMPQDEIGLFGLLGIGAGGFNSIFQINFLEILRGLVCKWWEDQRQIKGGCGQLPWGFWRRNQNCGFWGDSSIMQLHGGQPRPGVKEIFTPADPQAPVTIIDVQGRAEAYEAVIISCSPRALEMNIKINHRTFSREVWEAIRNVHLISSGKIFVRTKTAFWKDQNPASTLTCTITDEPVRAVYLFDFDDTPSGVICLSYTWSDSALKFNALSNEERVGICLRTLEKIYGRDLISRQIAETVCLFWEEAPGYIGAFKLTYPGHYGYQQALFNQPATPPPPLHNGVFLAGETTSWAGGWIEGALQSGLDAAMAVILRLGGTLHP